MKEELYQIADELRAVASTGLLFSENGYEKERCEKVLKASARLVAALEDGSPEEIRAQYSGNLAHVSPLPCVDSAVFQDGKILLIQRRDDAKWAMPGGLVEVGETWAEAAERELWEEAGVRGKVGQLLGVFDSRLWGSRSRIQLYMAVFLVEAQNGPLLHQGTGDELSSLNEVLDAGYFAENELPEMHPGHDLRVPLVFKLAKGELPAPYFDPA